MKICRVEEMRRLDREAVEKYGIDEMLLMENAGAAAAGVIARHFGGVEGKNIAVVCGGGNNGGDGFVIARHLQCHGAEPRVILASDPSKYRSAAKANYKIIEKLPLRIVSLLCNTPQAVDSWFQKCDAIVDALLGTGLDRNVQGGYADVIKLINDSRKKVFCVDIPSGVNGDTGRIMGTAVKGNCTITFGLPKIGNVLYPGFLQGGRLYLSHISFPREHYESQDLLIELNETPCLPPRDPAGHKGKFGDTLFIAGASSYYGAPSLSALSFLKAGGGYARLAAPRSIVPSLAVMGREIVFLPQDETASGGIARSNADNLVDIAGNVDFVVLGPGISLDGETQRLVLELAGRIEKPLLVDGDGITSVCADLSIIRNRETPTILTPHLGEMARITGKTIPEITDDIVTCLSETAADLNAIIVLKGAHSLIGYPDGRIRVNVSGNSGMATAGSGDVLTGTIAAMFGLGLSLDDAVAKGVFIHGFAGDLAAFDLGEDGMTAIDIMNHLPPALAKERGVIEEPFAVKYRLATVL